MAMVADPEKRAIGVFLFAVYWMLILAGPGLAEAVIPEGYGLVWEDNFDGPSIHTENWEHQVFPGIESGNHEFQYYTDRKENSFIRDGCLVIRAIKEPWKGHEYTSARLRTANKKDFRFGYIEARIKLPSGKGLWPAFWMLPTQAVYGIWPLSGEIDIVESVNIANKIHGTLHYGVPGHVFHGGTLEAAKGEPPMDFSKDFHTYAVEWEPTLIRWLVDGREYGRETSWSGAMDAYPAPFDEAFHVVLNLAVGGAWPGPPDETTLFPAEMSVDWVRVCQKKNAEPTVRILSPEPETHFPAGIDVPIHVEASDADGKIARILLFNGKEQIGQVSEPPYEYVIKGMPDGCHKLTVVALDDRGMMAKSIVHFKVGAGCPRAPYSGKAAEVPGRVEAEWFDEGVEGEAYHDTDAYNRGGAFRTVSGVDIEKCQEGGFALCWLEPGEWVEYAIEVKEARKCKVMLRSAAMKEGGAMRLEFPDSGKSLSFNPPATGDWQKYALHPAGEVELQAGLQRMRLTVEKPGFNLSYIDFWK